jgi:nicotinamidase-related amidase
MQIDPADVQIIFAHMQSALVQQSQTEEPERITRAATSLMKAAAALAIPVTFAIVPRADEKPSPIDELAPFVTHENTFVAQTASPFLGSDLRDRVINLECRTVIVCGITADGAVLHSSLDALALGLRVFVPIDAIGSRWPRAEQGALAQIERAGGEQTSTGAILTMLAPDFSQEPGATMLTLIEALEGL